jgi:hypothetical protein
MTIRSDLEAARAVIERDGFGPDMNLSQPACPTCFIGALVRANIIISAERFATETHLSTYIPEVMWTSDGVFGANNLRAIDTPAALAILDRAIAACGDEHG